MQGGGSNIIGIDLDNTIVDYDELFAAVSRDLVHREPAALGGKAAIRDAARRLPDGETKWIAAQAAVYGERMAEAQIMEGVLPFLAECRQRGMAIRIISHKTRYAAADRYGVDLR